VPLSETPLPNVTLPETVKWSSSKMSGTEANLFKKSRTYSSEQWLVKKNFQVIVTIDHVLILKYFI
jgi:hypothetical protein